MGNSKIHLKKGLYNFRTTKTLGDPIWLQHSTRETNFHEKLHQAMIDSDEGRI